MDKIQIKDKEAIKKEWTEQAEKQTLKTLDVFINHVMNDYEHDGRTFRNAICSCGLAAAYAACDSAGFHVGPNSIKLTETPTAIEDDALLDYVNRITDGYLLTRYELWRD